LPYEGNPKPRLARLLKSKSLMVNKGFRNKGIDSVSKKLKNYNFQIPITSTPVTILTGNYNPFIVTKQLLCYKATQ